MSSSEEKRENGFELDGQFYRWAVGTKGKDLMLIDRFARMPLQQFFELIDDAYEQQRIPVILAMVATSIQAGHPDWSFERVERKVMDIDIVADLTYIWGDSEEDPFPASGSGPATSTGGESSNGSKSTSSAPAPETSVTSSETLG